MIRIDIREGKNGKYAWTCEGPLLSGLSRQPLLDACRALKLMGVDPRSHAGLFRKGRSKPDLFCTVECGSRYTVKEGDASGPKFAKFEEFPDRLR